MRLGDCFYSSICFISQSGQWHGDKRKSLILHSNELLGSIMEYFSVQMERLVYNEVAFSGNINILYSVSGLKLLIKYP